MNTPTPAPSWPTRMAAIFNEWARRYSESPDSFGDVLGPDGKPVEDYGQRCATYFEQISRELYPSVKCTDPAQALANAALDWCEERGPRDRGDAELLKAMWNYSGDYVGPCAGCDGSCDEACAQSLTVAQAHAAIDRALEAHRAKIADVEERRSQHIQRLAQQAQSQHDELLHYRIHAHTLQAQLKPIASHFINGDPTRAETPTGALNTTAASDGGRNMFYEGRFNDETEHEQRRRLTWADSMRAAFERHFGVSWFELSYLRETSVWVAAWQAAGAQPAKSQHYDDTAVDRFAQAMKAKLAAGRAKGRAGWSNPGDPTDAQLAASLVKHLTKGNAGTFEDVANFCMFLHQRGASPSVLQHAALYTPVSNFQRNTLLIAIQEVREALQFASDSPAGPIRDTIWMMHRPETLLDFIDGTLKGLFPESTATAFVGARNMLYAGLFEDETEDERDARLALAHAMTQAAKGSG